MPLEYTTVGSTCEVQAIFARLAVGTTKLPIARTQAESSSHVPDLG